MNRWQVVGDIAKELINKDRYGLAAAIVLALVFAGPVSGTIIAVIALLSRH